MPGLDRYIRPTLLSLCMRYLPGLLHLLRFHVTSIRILDQRHSAFMSIDSIYSVFEVNYDAEPAFVTPEAALVPETPLDPGTCIPGSFFPCPVEDSGQESESKNSGKVSGEKVKRSWAALWRKVMGRASGHVNMSVTVSKCRIARAIGATEPKNQGASILELRYRYRAYLNAFRKGSGSDVIQLPENSSFHLTMTFGTLRDRQKRHQAVNSMLSRPISAYLAVNSIAMNAVISPVTLDMQQAEKLLLVNKLLSHQLNKEDSNPPLDQYIHRQAEALQRKKQHRQEALKAIGRAIDSCAVSVAQITLRHTLEASYLGPKISDETLKSSGSRDSGFVRMVDEEHESEGISGPLKEIVVALVINDFTLQSTSITTKNSSALRELFGRPCSVESVDPGLVRGMEINMRHSDMKLQRVSDMPSDRFTTLASTGPMEVNAITTIFSKLLGRNHCTYLDQPDHYLLQFRCKIDHFNVHASLDLLTQLVLEARTWAARQKLEYHPDFAKNGSANVVPAAATRRVNKRIPQIIGVCEIGNLDVRVASSELRSLVECRIKNSGMYVAGHTKQYDLCARVLNKDSKTKTRNQLQHDYTSAMAWDIGGRITKTVISIGNPEERGDNSASEIVHVGEASMTSNGTLRGRTDEIRDFILYDAKAKTGVLAFSIDGGVDLRFWRSETHKQIADWLGSLTHAQSMLRRPRNDVENSVLPDPLRSLPSGIAVKISTGIISIVIASRDPNPACDLGLIRGIHLQTALTLDYCYFAHQEQISTSRQLVDQLQRRSKLHLRAGLEAEAEALANKHLPSGGGAALFGINLQDTIVEPVFNAREWKISARTPEAYPSSADLLPPRTKRNPSHAVWDFQLKRKMQNTPSPQEMYSNNEDPLNLDYRHQIQKPIFSAPNVNMSLNIVRASVDVGLENQIIGRMSYAELSGDLSHIHCLLLAQQAIANCRPPKPTLTAEPSGTRHGEHRIPTTTRFRIDYLEMDILFPIGERCFWSISEVHVLHQPEVKALTVRSGMVFVPSARQVGKFEELGRFKAAAATIDNRQRPAITIDADALRIRVPYRYEPSKLFLNISATVKATRILLRNIKTAQFQVTQLPVAQDPKKIPDIALRLKTTSFEIKDDPLETKLNLIFRVGKTENGPRTVRQAYFDAKWTLIDNAEGQPPKRPLPASDLEELKERYNVDAGHSIPKEEAWSRFHKYNSDVWQERMRKARSVQNKREERELFRQYGYKTDYSDLPIDVVAPQRFAPLFRGSLDNLHVKIQNPELNRAGLLKHMEDHAGPFPAAQQFSLFVPLKIRLASDNVDFTLRDYPLPLWRIMPIEPTVDDSPAMVCDLTIVLAEELVKGDDTFFLIPCTVLPKGIGDPRASALELQIAKTSAPVKSYADVKFSIRSLRPTDFTWGVSYQPAISDLARAFASFSHPPRDPSPRLAFWDKFRLILHWQVAFDFSAPCHLHLKGEFNEIPDKLLELISRLSLLRVP